MHIATRHYDDRHPVTHVWFELQDRLYRISDTEFTLLVAGELPGHPPAASTLTLSDAFAWYRECPEQIQRAVIDGGTRTASYPVMVNELNANPQAAANGTEEDASRTCCAT